MTNTESHTAPLAGPREWIGLAVLAIPALLASLELTVTNLALPSIGRDLGAGSTQLLWVVDIYAFLLAGSLITMGAWGDRIGRRRILLIGSAGYGAASLLAAYAPNVETLIAARALMGVAGATLMPSTLSLAAAIFPDTRQRATAIAVIIASVSGGTAIGPLVGGALLERFWWGSAFLLAVPIMALLLLLVPIFLPEVRDRGAGRLDLVSAALSILALLPFVFGIKRIASEGVDALAVGTILLGVAVALLFVWRQRRLADPFVDLSLLRDRTFALAAATLLLGIFVLWGSNYAIAQYLQLVLGLSPLVAGLWTAPPALGVIVGSIFAPRLARRFRPTAIVAVGFVLSSLGYGVLAMVGGPGSLATLVAGAVIVSAGLGPMMALSTDLLIGSAPQSRAGAASAIASTVPQVGGALGLAGLGSIIVAAYRARVQGGLPPEGVPRTVREAVDESPSEAITAAVALDEPLASQVATLVREGLTDGSQLAALVCGAIILVAGAALFLLSRRT